MVTLFVLGLCFGSFVNALVYRTHENSRKKTKKFSIVNGRSLCVHCRHTLAWYDLVPVLSWLSLRGKCRYCKKPISWQYPLVELASATSFVFSYLFWPYGFNLTGLILFGFWVVFLIGFAALFVYDIRWMLLPHKIVYPLLALAVTQVLLHSLLERDPAILLNACFGLLTVGGLFYVLFQISGGKWIGGGDVKLGFMLGLLAGGFFEGLLVIFLASLIGTVVSIPILGFGKSALKKRIPFGPLLLTAFVLVYLFGSDIIAWYQTVILSV